MIQDLELHDEFQRFATITNLTKSIAAVEDVLPVVRKALSDRTARVRSIALQAAALSAERATDSTVEACNAALGRDPTDAGALAVLLFIYSTGKESQEATRALRQSLILRVIEEMPESPLAGSAVVQLNPVLDAGAYVCARASWMQHSHEDQNDTRVIGNAARFFQISEPSLASDLLQRCKSVEAGEAKWSRLLGNLYASRAWGEQADSMVDWEFRGLTELEQSLGGTRDGSNRFATLASLPWTALRTGDMEKARRYAAQLLAAGPEQEDAASRGLAFFEGRVILGWVALLEGDVDAAKAWLIWAVTPEGRGSRLFLGPWRPDLSLAKALLDRGEREAVLDFLRRCRYVEPSRRPLLDKWSTEILEGRIPNFDDDSIV